MEERLVNVHGERRRSFVFRVLWWARQMVLLYALVFLSWIFLDLVVPNRITVTVVNHGSEALRSAAIHVTGKDYPIGDLAPGASKSIFVEPRHDSDVEMSFAPGRRLAIGCYLLPRFKGEVRAAVTAERARLTRCDMEIAWI